MARAGEPEDYDLYVLSDAAGLSAIGRYARRLLGERARRRPFSNSDRGVRLFGDRIGWMIGGRAHDRPLDDIAEIRLIAGPMFGCDILFRDAYRLLISDGAGLGSADWQRSTRYRDFVLHLHESLLLRSAGRISLRYLYRPDRSSIRFLRRPDTTGLGICLCLAIAAWSAPVLFFGYGGKFSPARPGLLLPHPSSGLWFSLLMLLDLVVIFATTLALIRLTTSVPYDPNAISDRLLPSGAEGS
ncbi:MAG: hypothetical protein WA459_07240 [Stellaceae bacterium]